VCVYVCACVRVCMWVWGGWGMDLQSDRDADTGAKPSKGMITQDYIAGSFSKSRPCFEY